MEKKNFGILNIFEILLKQHIFQYIPWKQYILSD